MNDQNLKNLSDKVGQQLGNTLAAFMTAAIETAMHQAISKVAPKSKGKRMAKTAPAVGPKTPRVSKTGKKLGRPPGSKNKPKTTVVVVDTETVAPNIAPAGIAPVILGDETTVQPVVETGY